MSTATATWNRFLALVRGKGDESDPLACLLEEARPEAPLAEQVQWLGRLLDWVRSAPKSRHEFDRASGVLHETRLRYLLHLLDRNPELRRRFLATLCSLLKETSALGLFCHVGLGRHHGFVAEASERMLRSVLPKPPDERDLADLFSRVFDDEGDESWVRRVSPALLNRIASLFAEAAAAGGVVPRWRSELFAALSVLGARAASQGTTPDVLVRNGNEGAIPFLALNAALCDLARRGAEGAIEPERIRQCQGWSEACRGQVDAAYRSLESRGVSVGLVYTLENIRSTTRRIDLLLDLVGAPPASVPAVTMELLANLLRENGRRRTLRDLVRSNLNLLARKIVERAGDSGEHYISRSRSEYFAMLRAGLGGGAVMVLTTLLKFSIHAAHVPLFFEGFSYSLNYAGSFLLLQALGFTLATKQPSATASALAGKLTALNADNEVREFVSEACRMTRAQFASLVGNLAMLIPVALAVDLLVRLVVGRPVLGPETSHAVLGSLNPIRSFTIVNAALTGVLLWLSSLAAGWLENWVVFQRIPEALARSRRLVRVLGPTRARKAGEWVLKLASPLGGNVSLGFLMGFTSILGPFLGVPLDVRHVTLSAASLTFAGSSVIAAGEGAAQLILPALGILVIGALNFGVSYTLALLVATRAREVPRPVLRRLLRAMRVRFRRRGRDYFLPPREPRRPALSVG